MAGSATKAQPARFGRNFRRSGKSSGRGDCFRRDFAYKSRLECWRVHVRRRVERTFLARPAGRDKPASKRRRSKKALEGLGIHCICELYGCPRELLDDESFAKRALQGAVDQGMATLLGEVSHHFHPQGVTALALIAESHVAVHTWPEHGYVAVDVFTCGDRASAERACEYLVRAYRADRHTMQKLCRGPEIVGQAIAGPVVAEA